ncbi:Tubulin-specific chaperone cofactor E-like protein [Orchesella cincta]|uniref:Tubulin-specific chaperone cofactor E-like protein n=1 Tax=Orchesella cincta TaxID=48709 RepID=A0A1D2MIE4_ORCCI|nr:Tubulin-specific chaperone cofactor E-like protein [Orchesella cincta]
MEISKILQHTPSVSFLNLSFNSLSAHLAASILESSSRFPVLPRLSVLILIGTHVSWDSVWFLLRHCTTLQELHLSLNEFDVIDVAGIKNGMMSAASTQRHNNGGGPNGLILLPPVCNRSDSTDSGNGSSSEEDEGCSFPYLRRLIFDGNHVSSWEEISKLGSCFPSLRHLCLADCPISSIPENASRNFENLQSLNIANTSLKEMTDVSRLKKFPSLTDLRLQGIPFLSEMTAHERRQLVVALLPNVKKLNGGAPISHTEREDSERAFIRRFSQQECRPERYLELVTIHGELAPLVDIHLKPTTRVKVRICYGKSIVERSLSVYLTTNELKSTLESFVGVSSAKMRLFYVDSEMREVVGREEMRFPQKQLYSYNIQDDDEIHVELKTSVSISSAVA